MKLKYFQLGLPRTSPEPGSFTELCSRGGLTGAKTEVLERVKKIDLAFNQYHGYGTSLHDTSDVLNKTVVFIMESVKETDQKLVNYFVKMKFHHRIKCINEMNLLKKKGERKRKAEERGENFKRLKTMRDFTKDGHYSAA